MDDYGAGWFVFFDLIMNGATLLVYAGVYVLVSFATLAIFRKTGSADWKAWVPFVREWEMYRLAGMSPAWAIILPLGSMVVAFVGSVALVLAIFGAIDRGMAGNVGESIAFGFGGIAVLMLILLGWSVFALIVSIKMMNRINRGFEQPLVLTLLGVVVYPVWLAVLGWGAAQWRWASPGQSTRLIFPDGSQVNLREARVVIGSSIVSDGLPAGTQLVSVRDTTGTVAPFHAQLDRVGEAWMITDLQTITGTFVVDEHARAFRIAQPMSGVRSFMLGQVRVELGS